MKYFLNHSNRISSLLVLPAVIQAGSSTSIVFDKKVVGDKLYISSLKVAKVALLLVFSTQAVRLPAKAGQNSRQNNATTLKPTHGSLFCQASLLERMQNYIINNCKTIFSPLLVLSPTSIRSDNNLVGCPVRTRVNKTNNILSTWLFLFITLFFFSIHTYGQNQVKSYPVDAKLTFIKDSPILDGPSVLHMPGYFVWGGSVIEGKYGKYHMFFSRWIAGPDHPQFNAGWLINSEIGYAVSDYLDHGFRFVKVVLQGRRHDGDPDTWDAQSVHNPHIQKFNGKYYLYYIGSKDPGEQPPGSPGESVDFRNRIQQNQKMGVIVFGHFEELLNDDFERSDKPILSPRTRKKKDNVVNPSPRRTKAKPDNMIVVNPSVVFNPKIRKYMLYFKGNLYDPNWRGVHGVAIGDSPTGPFKALDEFVFDIKMEDGRIASAEDPYVWYNKTEGQFYAVIKDFSGRISGQGPGLARLVSRDGINWEVPDDPLFMKKELALKDGGILKVDRLERPQLLIDGEGNPEVLYVACAIENVNQKKDGSSFNVQIKLKE